MANITNPEVISFCNTRVRPAADALAQAYYAAKLVADEYYANNIGALIGQPVDVIVDGASVDGRHPITTNDVLLLITRLTDLVTDYEASSKAKLNTVLNVSVNNTKVM